MSNSLFQKSRDDLLRLQIDVSHRLSDVMSLIREGEFNRATAHTSSSTNENPAEQESHRPVPAAIPIHHRHPPKRVTRTAGVQTPCSIPCQWPHSVKLPECHRTGLPRRTSFTRTLQAEPVQSPDRHDFRKYVSDLRARIALIRGSCGVLPDSKAREPVNVAFTRYRAILSRADRSTPPSADPMPRKKSINRRYVSQTGNKNVFA